MREELHSEGVDLSRLAPAAWVATFALAFVANAVAAAGYGMSHVRMQSIVVLTLFTGWMALMGTARWVTHFREQGHHARAWAITAVVLIVAVVVMVVAVPLAADPRF